MANRFQEMKDLSKTANIMLADGDCAFCAGELEVDESDVLCHCKSCDVEFVGGLLKKKGTVSVGCLGDPPLIS